MREASRGEWTSASNAQADRLCQGRFQAQRGLPELPLSTECEAGTVVHALWTGCPPPRSPSAEEVKKAQRLTDQESAMACEFFDSGEDYLRFAERRLWHSFPADPKYPLKARLRTSGQFDVLLMHPQRRRALLLDGKSGWLPVIPNPFNLQLRRLAALLWLQFDFLEIGVSILTPFGPREPICLYSLSALVQSAQEMEYDVRASHAPSAPRTAGLDQCRYCRAREQCAERMSWLSVALPVTSPSLPMTSAWDWSPDQRVLFLQREKQLRDWLDARKQEIKKLLAQNPEAAPGYQLKPGRTLETITNPKLVFERFSDLGGTMEDFLKGTTITRSALREVVGSLDQQKRKKVDTLIDRLLSGCTASKSAAPTIETVK